MTDRELNRADKEVFVRGWHIEQGVRPSIETLQAWPNLIELCPDPTVLELEAEAIGRLAR